jgi:hypothetical protein
MRAPDTMPCANLKGFLRHVAGLLNRCPHWVTTLTPGQGHALAQSHTGLRYLIQELPRLPPMKTPCKRC